MIIMKMCQIHWDALKQAITDKGMFHLVSKDGHELLDRMKKELNEEFAQFDPLMSAHNSIVSAAIAAGGIGIMGRDENGNEYCPLCECDKHLPDGARDWIDGATECSLEYCREHDLLNKSN